MQQWQYMVAPISDEQEKRSAMLEHLGKNSWEMVSAVVPVSGKVIAFFKRPAGTGSDASAREALYR